MTNVVIMCGGSGTRLWPLSREKLPRSCAFALCDLRDLQQCLFLDTVPTAAGPFSLTLRNLHRGDS